MKYSFKQLLEQLPSEATLSDIGTFTRGSIRFDKNEFHNLVFVINTFFNTRALCAQSKPTGALHERTH